MMKSERSKWLVLLGIIALGTGFLVWRQQVAHSRELAKAASRLTAPKPLEQSEAFARFQRDIMPLLVREEQGESCVSCHEPDGKSPLVLSGNPTNDFKALMNGGFLFMEGPDTFLARVSTDNPKTRMPKGKHAVPWTDAEIDKLKECLNSLSEVMNIAGRADEHFPSALTVSYAGAVPQSLDNQFITYRQLRGKIQTIFGDDGVREGEDLFQKNLALFGGADFKERFNESSRASSSFLSGLEMVSREVADRAYTLKTGPFLGRPDTIVSPEKQVKPDAVYQKEIARIYQTMLYREPRPEEMQESFNLIRSVYHARHEILGTDLELSFQLTVEDPATGLKATRMVNIPVSGDFHGLYQELVDESQGESGKGELTRHVLNQKFNFKPDDAGQRLRLSNVNTFGNVSFYGIELRKAGTTEWRKLPATDPAVQADGAWKINTESGVTTFEDGNIEKETVSYVQIPVSVTEAGDYEMAVVWRRNSINARDVLVEVFSQGSNTLALASPPAVPPKGEAHFHYDSSADNIPYLELPGRFQFGESDLVEINNKDTRGRVTASAIRFVPGDKETGFLVDSKEAEGFDKWEDFDSGKFKSYNKVGTPVHDGKSHKGELFLRFKPSVKKGATEGWKPESFYRVQVNFPGKAGNELRVPLIVKAKQSAPIIQLVYPARARGEAEVTMDASSSYTVQGSKLKFTWKQVEGPKVKLTRNGPVLKFTAPRRSLQQAAWVALCRALMRHPDFLFTRPPALETTQNVAEKKRLQLVKLALDLTGRPPTQSELVKLTSGATWEQMVDGYLNSQEFKDFYFHRIRLYLESHGTEVQDEPARLWCYIAFNDLPFQQILTADYTVDTGFKKQSRPAYYGHTGVLTTQGFIEGKPGLPHYNYAAQVAMLFLGYVFEVPPEVVEQREGSTAASTVDPNGICYSCHKVLTPLAMQRNFWTDEGRFRIHDEYGLPIEASDGKLVEGYPFAGEGLEAFATQAVKKERFIRTIIDTHCTFYLGRQMRWKEDERALYKKIWDQLQKDHYTIRSLIRTLLISPEYLEGRPMIRPDAEASAATGLRAQLQSSTTANP